jgi:hypothetical protein
VDKTYVEKASLRFTIIDPETGGREIICRMMFLMLNLIGKN